jgi:hypothetical protein
MDRLGLVFCAKLAILPIAETPRLGFAVADGSLVGVSFVDAPSPEGALGLARLPHLADYPGTKTKRGRAFQGRAL